jgi:hypothetical protein
LVRPLRRFAPELSWKSALRFFDRRGERDVASNDALGLPCPWTPLQSITAAASRRFPLPGRDDGVMRGAKTPAKRNGVLRIRFWSLDPKVLEPGALVEVTSELDTWPELTESFGAGVIHDRAANRSSETDCRHARRRGDGRMASPRTARRRHRSEEVTHASRCRTPPRRGATWRSASGPFLATRPPRWLGRSGGLTEVCLAVAVHQGGQCVRDTQRENDDTSHGVRVPPAKSVQVVVAPVYLADTIRPQSFSLSRRFIPTWTLWLCFTPHPPMGFRPSELFPLSQPYRLSATVALLPSD